MKRDGQKYWKSLDERAATPAYAASLAREFPESHQDTPPTGLERREFLKLMGASLLMASAGCMRKPVEQIIPYVNQPEEVIPGVANWYASSCGGCAARCGVLVKTREGRPIKLEGNADHPMNRGGLCARGQASLLDLYDPDRLREPMRASRGGAAVLLPATWDEADQNIRDRFAAIIRDGGKVAVLTGAQVGPSTQALVRDFVAKFAGGQHVQHEAVVPEEVAAAQLASFGTRLVPRYRFDRATLVVSFGADFLGTWLSPVEFAKGFAAARRVEEGRMARFVTFEAAVSVTGTNADTHIPVRPGDELPIALALAHEIIVRRGVSGYATDADVVQALAPHDVATVARRTGVSVELLRTVAQELIDAQETGLVVGGPVKGENAAAVHVVVNLLNAALKNDGVTVDWSVAPSRQADSHFADLQQLIADMRAGQIAALVIHDADPVFTLPADLQFADALQKVPFVVTVANRHTATGVLSDWVIPGTQYLEQWDDAQPQGQLFTVAQPAVRPLHDTRAFQDSLLRWAGMDGTWHEFLKKYWAQQIYPQAESQSFESFWNGVLQLGFVDFSRGDRQSPNRLGESRHFQAKALQDLVVPKQEEGLRLVLYPSVAQLDGRFANNGWLQELPDPVTKISWDNYLSVAPATAKRLGVAAGDVVKVAMGAVAVELPVHVQPKMHESAVAVAVGYGQTHVGQVGNGVGVNVYPLQALGAGLAWSGQAVQVIKLARTYKLALMQDHQNMAGRPIIRETTFTAYQDNPASGNEREHEQALPTMWSEHEFPGYKWGMSVDLNACTGCNACMIACQSENNIPIVGRDQVIRGRDMHWIRVDRYYSGEEDTPEVAYQPMLCQHCDNAPCETVCPTLATYKSKEGLNMQAYNRCVGTRYCANNCPYKVRRFNYFDYSKQFVEPMNLVLNPDITTRTKGVMEKCTFCVQRIQEVKGRAKDEQRTVRDGEIKTACQQSCPADAIVFGNVNDLESRASKMRQLPRGYHVLEELNVRPQVTYLLKVRNTRVS